jgi:hypothetical protein
MFLCDEQRSLNDAKAITSEDAAVLAEQWRRWQAGLRRST